MTDAQVLQRFNEMIEAMEEMRRNPTVRVRDPDKAKRNRRR